MLRSFALTLSFCLAAVTAQAALVGRAPVTLGGTDYQAYFDTSLNITWSADANVTGPIRAYVSLDVNGDWYVRSDSITQLTYLGTSQWRLPKALYIGDPGCFDECASLTEMGHLWYMTLGNSPGIGADLQNTGSFKNVQTGLYWIGTPYFDGHDIWPYYFNTRGGYTGYAYHIGGPPDEFYAWPVLDGDPFAVPLPATAGLLATSLAALGWMSRRAT